MIRLLVISVALAVAVSVSAWQISDDTNGDGILDDDEYPNDAEIFNGYEDEDGCPEETPEVESLGTIASSVTINLESVPSGAKVYLVPLFDWEESPNDPLNDAWLKKYQVYEGNTPVKAAAYEMVYMIVFDLSGIKEVMKVNVTGGITVKVIF